MLDGKQRAYLRKAANGISALVTIGKGGISENLIAQIDETLNAYELVKIKLLETSMLTPKEAMDEICDILKAEPVQHIGSKFVIYRMNKEEKDRKIKIF